MTMHLVQILLPVSDSHGKPFADATLRAIQKELADGFGGVTAYNRAPAKGSGRAAMARRKTTSSSSKS